MCHLSVGQPLMPLAVHPGGDCMQKLYIDNLPKSELVCLLE